MSLVFVRHGESTGNVMTRDQRAESDIPNHAYPLTARGVRQAEIVGQHLLERFGPAYFGMVFQSDFLRSIQTLDVILDILKPTRATRVSDSRLNERWDGIFHELTQREIETRYPEQIRLRRRTGYHLYRAPGGENGPDVEMRILSFLRDYEETINHRSMLIVGHGRWLLYYQKILHGWSVERCLEEKEANSYNNCSVLVYRNLQDQEPSTCTPWEGLLSEIETQHA